MEGTTPLSGPRQGRAEPEKGSDANCPPLHGTDATVRGRPCPPAQKVTAEPVAASTGAGSTLMGTGDARRHRQVTRLKQTRWCIEIRWPRHTSLCPPPWMRPGEAAGSEGQLVPKSVLVPCDKGRQGLCLQAVLGAPDHPHQVPDGAFQGVRDTGGTPASVPPSSSRCEALRFGQGHGPARLPISSGRAATRDGSQLDRLSDLEDGAQVAETAEPQHREVSVTLG